MRATVILAAGRGSRLGGQSKPLLRINGELLVVRALRTAHQAGTTPVLVLSHRSTEVLRTLRTQAPEELEASEVVELASSSAGLSLSFRTGIRHAADRGAEQIAVLLVDQPWIGAEALRTVLEAHQRGRITRGLIRGQPSHPVVFDREDALAAASQAQGDDGARHYLRAHRQRSDLIDLSACADDADIDTPDDLRSLAVGPGLQQCDLS
ncbi:nucleotidyltransferase family protein [Nesterenkonia salmonea]|uniref:nucleotidyltransferase family protein n=1 Tax=Nesterenkonia salmonea TaxID=1804987 RepID=UPI001408AC75|nr:NTP transferase domain-containing protein [Nesterenkonia salmonea]